MLKLPCTYAESFHGQRVMFTDGRLYIDAVFISGDLTLISALEIAFHSCEGGVAG